MLCPRAMSLSLTARARAQLKSLAHGLVPVVQVGAEGLTPAVARATTVALEDHELVKVKLGQGFTGERGEAGEALAQQTDAALVQVIGRVIVLYRRRCKDDPKRPRIELVGAGTIR